MEWNCKRVTSVTSDDLNWIQEEIPWRAMLREQSCDPDGLDVHATKTAIGHKGIAESRAQNVRMKWNRYPLRVNECAALAPEVTKAAAGRSDIFA